MSAVSAESIPSCDVGRETLVIGTYGGGDNLSMWDVVCALRYPHQFVTEGDLTQSDGVVFLADEFRLRILSEARVALERLTADQREIYRLPAALSDDGFSFSFSIVLTSGPPASTLNLFAQGWLFANELRADPGRLGISRYPLCGVFSPSGLQTVGEDDPACLGFGTLTPADQHCHYVCETLEIDGISLDLADWHVGGDMARFAPVNSDQSEAAGLFVAVDLETKRCEFTFIVFDMHGKTRSSPLLKDPEASSLLCFQSLLEEISKCGVVVELPSSIFVGSSE